MNIRDLEYIVEVAKQRNFTKAANTLYVSQPALTIQIRKVEEHLGVKIFERENYSFLITEAGEKIIKKAQEILLKTKEIKEIAKSSQDQFRGDFKLGAFPTLASYFFPKISGKIVGNFPKIKLFLVEEKTSKLLEKLKSGEIDAAFLADPIVDGDLSKAMIFSEPFVLAVSNQHPLAKKKIIHRKELKGQSLMLLEEGHCLRDQALEVCEISGAFEQSDFRASSLETLRQMVRINAGITLIPQIAALKDNKIIYLKIKDAPKRKIALYWRKNYYRDKLIADFVKNITDNFSGK